MTVRIVTDSTCDLSRAELDELGVTVVPLSVYFGDEEYLDAIELDPDAFYERLATYQGQVRTSQPPVERFRQAYAALRDEGARDVVSIHISSRLSGTLNSASIAREELVGEMDIDVVDSYNVSLGLGAVVLEAALAAQRGASRNEVAETARREAARVHVIATFDTLEFLRRGGRIGRARSLLGSILSIKPILHVDQGELNVFERVRTRAKALDRMVELAAEDQRIKRLFVAYGADLEAAETIVERVRPRLPHTDIRLGRIGAAVGVHGGPGLVGFCTSRRE